MTTTTPEIDKLDRCDTAFADMLCIMLALRTNGTRKATEEEATDAFEELNPLFIRRGHYIRISRIMDELERRAIITRFDGMAVTA